MLLEIFSTELVEIALVLHATKLYSSSVVCALRNQHRCPNHRFFDYLQNLFRNRGKIKSQVIRKPGRFKNIDSAVIIRVGIGYMQAAMAEAFLNGRGGGGAKTNDQIFFIYNQGRQCVARILKEGGGIISTFLVKHIFFSRTNLKQIKKQEKLLGVRGHAPPGNFENLHAATAILVLF